MSTESQELPGERLAKRVAQMLGCSRSEAEQYIAGGFVRVDGMVVEDPPFRVQHQAVTVDADASLLNLNAITLVLNKPQGWLDGLTEAPIPSPHYKGKKPKVHTARELLTPAHRSPTDANDTRVLKRHFNALEASAPLETGASGLVVFTQDWRTQRKLIEDLAVMEHELILEVKDEVLPEALIPIERALRDERQHLPHTKVSVGSSGPQGSRLRLAVKGAHPGLAAHLCQIAGLELLGLRRIRLGRVGLGELAPGQWRLLAEGERF
jgi:23S rRNA pseudouridine2604 synthase